MRRTRKVRDKRDSVASEKVTIGGEAMKYQAVVDLRNKNNSHTQLVLVTGEDKKVLEVGPAWGYMSRVLKQRGCRVTGVEVDPVAAKVAEQFCDRMIVGDIEELDFSSAFHGERFDVVIYGDVLEHLIHPEEVLQRTTTILKPGGYVAASIPNVAHGSVRLALLAGEFGYTDLGILDKTHLRFYTRTSIRKLFREGGLTVRNWKRILLDPFQTEVPIREEDFPPSLVEQIRRDQDAMTYQYVVKATVAKAFERQRRSRSVGKIRGQVVHNLRQYISLIEAENLEKDRQIATKDSVILSKNTELEGLIADRDHVIAEKDAVIEEKEAAIHEAVAAFADKEQQAASALRQYEAVTNTIGYRFLVRIRRTINRLAPPGTRRRSVVVVLGHGLEVLITRGWGPFIAGLLRFWRWIPRLFRPAGPAPPQLPTGRWELLSPEDQYQLWLHDNELTAESKEALVQEAARLAYRPKISIIVPVYNTERRWLAEAIESVRSQIYDNWELCLADDGSTRLGTKRLLRKYRRRDRRIQVEFLKTNRGIAHASNAALALATGEFVGLLDHDDELKPDALFEVVKLLNEDRDLDYIYSDEDKKDGDGRLVEPFFKPDWSPDLLQSINYVTHFSVYRRRLLDEVSGFREGFDGSQDYDLVLRVTELTDRVAHIAKPLYTWRKVAGSAAGTADAKPFALEAAKRALTDSLRRRRFSGEVLDGLWLGSYRVRYSIVGTPLVEIIIPTRDKVDLLASCIDSIKRQSTYHNYHLVVVDNQSRDSRTLRYLEDVDGRVIKFADEFNFARILNVAARETKGDFLLFLNNDTEVVTPEWIEALVEHAQRTDVAAVGARLLYPEGRPQHEGIIIGLAGGSAINMDYQGYFGLGQTIRNCSAVTGACMMVRRELYWELGGFEERLGVAFNDVDFCLRAREKGYQVVYTPFAVLRHYESATRGRLHPEEDEQFFRARWGNPGDYRDPYYNPNLDPAKPFHLRSPTSRRPQ